MSVVNNNLLLAAEDADLGYVIDRSVRFRSSASAYLNRTPASAGNRKTWTWSGWVKRGDIPSLQQLFGAFSTNTDSLVLYVAGSAVTFGNYSGSINIGTAAVLRDPSAWYHIIVALDTTQAVATNRVKIYVNSVEQAQININSPSQNYDGFINAAIAHGIGAVQGVPPYYFDGYLTEINFVDGQALTPSSFGEYNEDTGVWQPKEYAGTYGTNGFYLNFGNPTTLTTLTADQSGNGNNWTANNISLTSGATFDSMIDTPTPVEDERGNFCVLNPLNARLPNTTASNGNLKWVKTSFSDFAIIYGSFGMSSGKWYFESTVNSQTGNFNLGVSNALGGPNTDADNNLARYSLDAGIIRVRVNSTSSTTVVSGVATSTGTIGVAFDADAGTCEFYHNNTLQGTVTGMTLTTYFPQLYVDGTSNSSTVEFNFGQRPFEYTPPSGFKALHTGNLPEPAIVDGGEYFNTVLYTGTGGTNNVTGVGFQPDWTWLKDRTTGSNHRLHDAVRGAGINLSSSTTDAETNESASFTAFTADGFSLAGSAGAYNASGRNYVTWNWKANGAGVSNTAGSITSTVSANTTSGFSIVSSVGTGAAGTTGHGLGVKPAFIIRKSRTSAFGHWYVYHHSVGASSAGILQLTNAFAGATAWNSTEPTSTVFSVGSAVDENKLNDNYITYCFAEVPGYSRFGSYTGNGSADGPFIFTGFRPAFVIQKAASGTSVGADGFWNIADARRAPQNFVGPRLAAQSSAAEDLQGTPWLDILSNGFKLRSSGTSNNNSGTTYIYMAFAETDFANALAR